MLEDLLALLVGEVAPHAADGVDGVVDPVAADLFQDVHDEFAVAPDQHEHRVEADLVGGHAEPEQMAVQPLQFADQRAQIEPAPGHFQLHDFFDRLNERGGVRVRADAADALQEVKALVIVALLAGFFDPAVVVADVHPGADDFLAVDVEVKFGRFLEERMLGADR